MEKFKKFIIEKQFYVWLGFILVGMVLIGAGFAMADFDIYAMQTVKHEPFEKVSKTTEINNLDTISIDSYQSVIIIEPSTDDQLHLYYGENEEYPVDIEQSETSLQLKRKTKNTTFGFRWFNFAPEEKMQIKVMIPKAYQGKLNIENSYEDIIIKEIGNLKDLRIDSDHGDVTLEKVNAKAVYIESSYDEVSLKSVETEKMVNVTTDHGEVTADNITAGVLNLDVSYGEIEADHITVKDNISMEAYHTGVTLGEVSAGNLRIENEYAYVHSDSMNIEQSVQFYMDHSSLKLRQIQAEEVSIEGSYGDLDLEEVVASTIDITVSHGSLKAMINDQMQSYAISSSVDHGENNLPSDSTNSANKKLNVEASYGDVDVKFMK